MFHKSNVAVILKMSESPDVFESRGGRARRFQACHPAEGENCNRSHSLHVFIQRHPLKNKTILVYAGMFVISESARRKRNIEKQLK